MNRIRPVDGLRACAVVGVLWAHIWMFFGNIPTPIAGFDINKIISFGGIGVDLFFVISGFCMYLMYAKKSEHFSTNSYFNFLSKRWTRIAPAFYFIVLVECLVYVWSHNLFPFQSLLSHYLFINTFYEGNVFSPSFWSLATEWHFYLILPFLFIGLRDRNQIVFRILILMAVCIVFRLFLFSENTFLQGVTVTSDMIWYRFVEFGFGILAAWYYTANKELPRWLKGNFGFLITLAIAFVGRGLMSKGLLVYFGSFAFVGRALGEPVLTFGFALMILNVVNSQSLFSSLLASKPFNFVGRISYSLYLCHWIIAVNVAEWVVNRYGVTQMSFQLTFFGIFLLLLPVSYLSYKFLEEPYFKKSEKKLSINAGASVVPKAG